MANANAKSFVSTKQFPEHFLLGTATTAFQVEGAWDEDKPTTIWDDYFHNQTNWKNKYSLDMPQYVIEEYQQKGVQPRLVDTYKGMSIFEVPKTAVVADDIDYNFNGDIAADSYHKTDVDIKLLKELGVQVYRFSFNINRIIPEIYTNKPGQNGINYYNNLINKLIENGITPMVLLYSYELPTTVNHFGGLSNVLIRNFYIDYCKFCFETFGDRVKYWEVCADIQLLSEGYGSEHFAPGYQEQSFSGYVDYIVSHNVLLTLCKIGRMYNNEFKEKQKGEISFSINGTWFYPQDPNNPEHKKIAEFANLSTFGMVLHALATGKYPTDVLEAVEKTSKKEGLSIGRLLQYTEDEQEIIKGAYDFIVLNYYGCVKVRPLTEEELSNEPNLKRRDRGFWMDFENITPAMINEGFLNCLKYINKTLDNPKIFIGENGFPEDEGVDDSKNKIAYHTGILNKLLEALDEHINVIGYCVWSFIDTLEYTFGYSKKYGIYAVDFNDPTRPRTKKKIVFHFFNSYLRPRPYLPVKIKINLQYLKNFI